MKRLFAFDLDGTISAGDRRIPADALASIDKIRARGDLVAFVTGRRQIDMLPMRDQVSHADYLALNNGAYVFRVGGEDEPLIHERVPERAARILIERALADDLILDVITNDAWYATCYTEADREYAQKLGCEPQIFTELSAVDVGRIEGFMIAHAVDEVCAVIDEHGLPLQCVESEPDCADIMDARASKWSALELIGAVEGVDAAHVIAMGNYTNDIEMIEGAGLGVAVADALPEVRSAADLVLSRRHDENPVAELIEHVSTL